MTGASTSGGSGAAPWPLVTVNILAYNRREELRTTLNKILHELDYPRERLEVIVVDNASTDGTKQMVAGEFPDVRVIVNERNVGVSGWNRGFAEGKGDYFLVLDDDCYISGQSLQCALDNAGTHQADLVSFLVANPYQEGYFFNKQLYNTGILAFWGCSALISRNAITALGGFDPQIFIWAHEMEFTMRLLDRGMRHLFLPEVISYHMKPNLPLKQESFRALVRKMITTRTFSKYAGPFWEAIKTPCGRASIFHWRNITYIAGKQLQTRDAVSAFCNIVTRSMLAPREGRQLLPVLTEGFRAGLRHRAPVRDEVSSIYRQNILEYVVPIYYWLDPKKAAQFYNNRPIFYPVERSVLQI